MFFSYSLFYVLGSLLSFREAEILRRRAQAFLKNPSRLLEEKEWDLAVFCLEQYCQLLLKYKLLVKRGVIRAVIPYAGSLESLESTRLRCWF